MKTFLTKIKTSLRTGNREQLAVSREQLAVSRRSFFTAHCSLLPANCYLLIAICSLLTVLSCESPFQMEQPFKAGLGPIIDLQQPEIELTSPIVGTYIRGTVTFSGWVRDDSHIDSVWFQLSNYPQVDFNEIEGLRPGYSKDENDRHYGVFYRLPDAVLIGDSRSATWSFTIDTKMLIETEDAFGVKKQKRAFREGDPIKIRMLAKDNMGKENANISSEYVFYVKNEGPRINVDTPVIREGKAVGNIDPGGDNLLNYGYLSGLPYTINVNGSDQTIPNPLNITPFKREILIPGGSIRGRISDDEGINYFLRDTWVTVIDEDGIPQEVELFPPQIRIWEVDTGPKIWGDANSGYIINTDAGNMGTPVEPVYMKGYFPSIEDVPWVAFMDLDPLVGGIQPTNGEQGASFYYNPDDKSGKFYGFEIRAQSIDKVKSGIRYPGDYYKLEYPENDDQFDTAQERENSYVLVNVRENGENPSLDLYRLYDYSSDNEQVNGENITLGLQDLFSDRAERKNGDMWYPPLSYSNQQINDRNHPYIEATPATTNGPFTLRIKASHSQNIKYAEVYWEKYEDKSRGRFIWDPANEDPYKNSVKSWSTPLVPGSRYFKEWGYNEPDSAKVRSYIFTYHNDPALDKISASAGYSQSDFTPGSPEPGDPPIPSMWNRSKIQKYTGKYSRVRTDKDGNKTTIRYDFDRNFDQVGEYDWDNVTGEYLAGNPSVWQDMEKLGPGTYNLRVYATSSSGSRAAPLPITIRIDQRAPAIELTDIIGKASELYSNLETNPVVVNGVIRPEFTFSESWPEDTGIRTGSTDYFLTRKASDGDPNPTTYYPERAYILVPEAQKDTLEGLFSKTVAGKKVWLWPEFDKISPNTPPLVVFPYPTTWYTYQGSSLKISKHGVIENLTPPMPRAGLFLTSSNYAKWNAPIDFNNPSVPPFQNDEEPLADGKYRMYVFARDNAFNVGCINFPINVQFDSDTPKFTDFAHPISNTVKGVPDVTDPNHEKDRTPTNGKYIGFIDGSNNVRNKFTLNSFIQVTITDDDSLDLGQDFTTTADSKVKVSLYGSKVNNGRIVELAEIKLKPEQIKEAFAPQGDDGTGNRQLVKERTGKITQKMLYDALTAASIDTSNTDMTEYKNIVDSVQANYNMLPDGIYKIKIEISDWTTAKLRELKRPNPNPAELNDEAEVKNPDREFWIVADNKKPKIEITEQGQGTPYTRPEGVISAGGEEPLVGQVSDENGPITLTGWTVYDGSRKPLFSSKQSTPAPAGTPYINTVKDNGTDGLEQETISGSTKWDYKFEYQMVMNPNTQPGQSVFVSDAFIFEITFKDRFGNEESWSRKYTIDNKPPQVTLYRPIETFSRPYDQFPEVTLTDESLPGSPDTENRERLAVKTVRFSITATDNDRVAGIRWWLLPANVQPKMETDGTSTAFETLPTGVGEVTSYNAYPSSLFNVAGTYYSNQTYTVNGTSVSFAQGAYGYIYNGASVNGSYTISVDSNKMSSPNGEYRLHIIAIDRALNTSQVSASPVSNCFQTVYFLQKADEPYFALNVGGQKGAVVTNGTLPTTVPFLYEAPIIEGNILDNNGFSPKPSTPQKFWDDTIAIWFNKDGGVLNDATIEAYMTVYTTALKNGTMPPPPPPSLTGFDGPKIIPKDSSLGLAIQKTNLSFSNVALTDFFPTGFNTEGRKSFIIMAMDSPVGKLKDDKLPSSTLLVNNGIPMGTGATDGDDKAVRAYSWKQYVFEYDAVPPKIEIYAPAPRRVFGTDFGKLPDVLPAGRPGSDPILLIDNAGFNIVGSISDTNLKTDNNGKYYFEYYLDNNTTDRKRFTLEFMDGVSQTPEYWIPTPLRPRPRFPVPVAPWKSNFRQGKHIYFIATDNSSGTGGKITVFFMIGADEVWGKDENGTAISGLPGMIPQFLDKETDGTDKVKDGTHNLNLFAWDKSGNIGTSRLTFLKDTDPPVISFTNLNSVNRPYTATNPATVIKDGSNPRAWWLSTSDERQPLLLGTSPLTLTTLSHNGTAPVLSGIITDIVSYINVTIDTSVTTHNANASTSNFKYKIDNENSWRTAAAIDADVNGTIVESRTVRWDIDLTNAAGTDPLYDGVHTIVLDARDQPGNRIPVDKQYMIAFRIDSKLPKITKAQFSGPLAGTGQTVIGSVANQTQGATVFSIDVEAEDANLNRVEMTIKGPDKKIIKTVSTGTVTEPPPSPPPANPPAVWVSGTWTYLIPGDTGNSTTDDYTKFAGSYNVDTTVFNAGSGTYEISIVSYDTARNASEAVVKTFIYDASGPGIVFTSPADNRKTETGDTTHLVPSNLIDATAVSKIDFVVDGKDVHINRIATNDLKIQGNVRDTLSPIIRVESRVEMWNWEGANAGEWTEVQGWTTLYENSTNTQLQVSWTKNLLGQNQNDLDLRTKQKANSPVSIEQDASAAEGLYRIQIRAKDMSKMTGGQDSAAELTTAWPATENGNPSISQYQYFYFDQTNPALKIRNINGSEDTDGNMNTYYPKPKQGTKFWFEGTVKDSNRVAKVEVRFEGGKTPILPQIATRYSDLAHKNVLTSTDQGPDLQYWRAEFANMADIPDGRYKVVITAYDMAGRSSSEEKSFILDGTPPGAKFTGPVKASGYRYGNEAGGAILPLYGEDEDKPPANSGYASVIVQGGTPSVITGETWDRPGPVVNGVNLGESGSESGVDKMWFRLGYIDGDSQAAFPNRAAIENDEIRLIINFANLTGTQAEREQKVKDMDPKTRNNWMDEIAEYTATGNADTAKGNSWFMLGSNVNPPEFVINNPNIYDWRMEIPNSLKTYCDPITVKNRSYNAIGNDTFSMARRVDGQAGVYRLPLWIRLSDIAGNVAYYCHDIWIYPDGAIPSTTIESPINGTMYNARGGAVSVDGVAKSNSSVYRVIFRVFADGVKDTNLSGIQTGGQPVNPAPTIGTNGMPSTANLITISPDLYKYTDSAALAQIPLAYRPGQPNGSEWQEANLTKAGGLGEPIIPWNIMLSTEDQWANIIKANGFASGGGDKDRVRIWLEVFVLGDKDGSPNTVSIYPSDADPPDKQVPSTLYGTSVSYPANAKPYVRAFYIQTGSAAITHPNVGSSTSLTQPQGPPFNVPFVRRGFMWNAEKAGNQGGGGYEGAGTETRSNRFAISATLDPNPNSLNGGLGEVSYRIKLDGGSYSGYTTVWKNDPNFDANPLNAVSPGVKITSRTDAPASGPSPRTRYYFDFAFDSKITASTADFAAVNNGNWANSGGTITVQIRMRDRSNPPNEAEQTIQVQIDNFAPVADTAYRTNPTVAGSNVNFIGRVYDYATAPASSAMNSGYAPRKLERVSVWFTKEVNGETRYVNMNGGADGKPSTTATLTSTRSMTGVLEGRAASIDGGGADDPVRGITITAAGAPINAAANRTYPGLGDYVRDISQSTAGAGTGMLWSPINSANYDDVRWAFTLDSTKLPDGKLTLHYIVVDAAGNATYYKQEDIVVKNNYPEISKVTLYTYNVGISSYYTAPAEVEYYVNDYRARMFANYKDPDNNEWLTKYGSGAADASQTNPNLLTSRRRADTTGYLNSGFISKNNYIGFKVEAGKGNRPLNFRLEHVTRERVTLTRANLQKLLDDRNAANNINLYTIAWHGDYSSGNWRDLGVHIDDAPLGTHFVLQTPKDSTVNVAHPLGELPADFKSGTAEVWKYTLRGTGKTIINQGTANSDNTITVGQAPAPNSEDNVPPVFGFSGADFTNISSYDGSHPDSDDTKPDNPTSTYLPGSTQPDANGVPGASAVPANTPYSPNGTAFFLIRVWDSVVDGGNENDQLYDALVIGMNVYKGDTNPPTARLYDLNPYTEKAVTRNNIDVNAKNATKGNAADPQGIGSNIVRGGLYNTGTDIAMVRSGFIDPRDGSKALNPVNSGRAPLPDYALKVDGDSVPAAGANPALDKVSGEIILRGYAWDDQLIGKIQITIGTTTRNIIELDEVKTSPTYGKMKAASGYEDTAFYAEDLHWKTGHTVEWAYIWNTGDDPSASTSVQVTVIDAASLSSTAVPIANETGTTYHNQVDVQIVPYITGFERETPQFTTKRSLQGWYSFYQGETGIRINGYNFGTTNTTTVTINGNAVGTTGGPAANSGKTIPTQRTFGITASNISSGEIIVRFNNIEAYNNGSSTANKSWNRDFSNNTPGSDLWINKPYAHIWRTVQEAGTATTAGTIFADNGVSAGLDSPGMALQYTASTEGGGIGRLHGVWTTYGRESFFYAQNRGDLPKPTNQNQTPPSYFNNAITNPTINNATSGEGTYGRAGSVLLVKSGEPYSAGDIDYYNNPTSADYRNNISAVAAYQRDGGPWLILKPRLSAIVFNNNASTDGGGTDSAYSITRESNPVSTYRWRNTRIKKVAPSTSDQNPGKVFVTAYDLTNKRLFFKTVTGNVAPSAGTTANNGGTEYYLDGGAPPTATPPTPVMPANLTGIQGIAASTQAGNWAALDYTSQGNPVIAYFDEQNQTLRIICARNDNPTTGADWTRSYVLPAGHALYRGSGSYVSMAIDRNNGNRIHLAFYNSNNEAVVYASGTIVNNNFVLASASVIDRVVKGGQWTDISVDSNGNPWIVYADSARLGNRDGARVAYRSYDYSNQPDTSATVSGTFGRPLTDPITGTSIRGWEALTMPANYQVNDDRLNIEAWPPAGYANAAANPTSPIGGWNAAVGYASDQFRIGYFVKPANGMPKF